MSVNNYYNRDEMEAIEYGMKEQDEYFTKKMRYLRFQATQENEEGVDMDELCKEIMAFEKINDDDVAEEEHEEDEFDCEMRAYQELYDDNFNRHQKNVSALATYYEQQGDDAEYEFWLLFEIREYENGSTNVVDVELAQYGPKKQEEEEEEDDIRDWHYDEHDRMEDYIEGKMNDALDDSYNDEF